MLRSATPAKPPIPKVKPLIDDAIRRIRKAGKAPGILTPERGRRAPLAGVRRAVRRGRRGCRHPRARRRGARGKIQIMKPEIIITAKGHAGTMATLQSEFTTHLLADAPDRNAFLKQHAPNVRGLATFGPMPVDGKLMDALPKLEIISNFGVGVDAINLDDAKKRNIIVTNTPDVLNECVADTALALILNTLRSLPQSEKYLRGGNWASARPLSAHHVARRQGAGRARPGTHRRGDREARHGLRHEDPLPQPQQEGRALPLRSGSGHAGEEFRRAGGRHAGRVRDRQAGQREGAATRSGPRAIS